MNAEVMVPVPISLIRKTADFIAASHSELEKVAVDCGGRARVSNQLVDALASQGLLSPKQKQARAALYVEQPVTALRDFVEIMTRPQPAPAGRAVSHKQAGVSSVQTAESSDDVFERIVMAAGDPMTGI